MTEDRTAFENAEECIKWVSAGMALPFFQEGITDFNHTSSTSDRPNQTICSQRRPMSARTWSIIERWNQRGWCLLHTDWLNGSGRGLHAWNLDRLFLLIRWNERRQTRLSQNFCNLRNLRWALTYITKTSKHNFRGLILRFFLQLSSYVFLSLPVSHSSGGIPPLPPPPCCV